LRSNLNISMECNYKLCANPCMLDMHVLSVSNIIGIQMRAFGSGISPHKNQYFPHFKCQKNREALKNIDFHLGIPTFPKTKAPRPPSPFFKGIALNNTHSYFHELHLILDLDIIRPGDL